MHMEEPTFLVSKVVCLSWQLVSTNTDRLPLQQLRVHEVPDVSEAFPADHQLFGTEQQISGGIHPPVEANGDQLKDYNGAYWSFQSGGQFQN